MSTKAIVTTSSCAFEFGTYGTCCDEQDVRSHAKSKTKELMDEVSFINQEYKRFRGVLSKSHELLQEVAAAPKDPNQPKWDAFIKGAQEKLKHPKFQEYFATHMDSAEDGNHFVRENTKCWEMQSKARNVALCYTCSGRSSHFFKDNKALISQETCDAFVRDCGYSLAALVKFILSFQKAQLIFEGLKSLGINLNFNAKLDFPKLTMYFSAFKTENVEQIIEAATNLHKPEVQAQMCSKFLRLGEKPIISQMRTIFKSSEPWTLQTHEMATYLAEVQKQAKRDANASKSGQISEQETPNSQDNPTSTESNWNISRRLQFNGSQDELLQSDSTIMDVNDPSYSSVGVSGNSPMDFGHQFP